MSDNLVLQETIRIDSATAIVTQPQSGWVGVAGIENLTNWVEVRGINLQGGTAKIYLETAPEPDEKLFVPMVAGEALSQEGLTIVKVLLAQNPDVPVGRWIRWRLEVLNAGAPWFITFRVLSCCSPGRR
jgi:hypothetical protein